MLALMDAVRLGLAVRALRRRRGWTQRELGARCGLSQSTISDVECGLGFVSTVDTLMRLVAALGARVDLRILSHGEDLDRLLDARHADIVEHVAAFLRRHGWQVVPEVTFSVYGERGSIDLLAYHPATGSLLVVEVKSAIPDVQRTLAGIDRKARLAVAIAKERGWQVSTVSRWLVVAGDATTRRRIHRHDATFAAALPGRTTELTGWARKPTGATAGVMFVAASASGSRHRVRRQAAA